MDYGFILFLVLVAVVIVFERKKFKREGLVFLRRSERGVKYIEGIGSKYRERWNVFADLGIVLSFGLLGLWFLWREYGKEKKVRRYRREVLFFVLYVLFAYFAYFKGGAIVGAIVEMFKIHLNAVNPMYLIYFSLTLSVLFGISGYAFSIVLLGGIAAVWNALIGAKAKAPLQLVLPFHVSSSSALPVLSVPFDKWLIALSIIVVVHEFSHAFVSAAQRIKVKSLGYGFFVILPVGFAEPDEKELEKSKVLSRVRVYAAGSMANLTTALVFGLLLFALSTSLSPFISHSYNFEGISYEGLVNNTSAYSVLPQKGVITSINNVKIENFTQFIDVLLSLKPGDNVSMEVNNQTYYVVLSHNPSNHSVAFIGILNVKAEYERRKGMGKVESIELDVVEYVFSLFKWIILLNIGIAIANLLPLVPLDGGLMIKDMSESFIGENKIWKWISLLTLLFLLLALFSSLIGKVVRGLRRLF